MLIKYFFKLIFIVTVISIFKIKLALAERPAKLTSDRIYKLDNTLCGLINQTWTPGIVKKNLKFYPLSYQLELDKKAINTIKRKIAKLKSRKSIPKKLLSKNQKTLNKYLKNFKNLKKEIKQSTLICSKLAIETAIETAIATSTSLPTETVTEVIPDTDTKTPILEMPDIVVTPEPTSTPNQDPALAFVNCYESSIVFPKPFSGNDDEIFKLSDGSIWQVKDESSYLNVTSQTVLVCPDTEKLWIEGKSLNISASSFNYITFKQIGCKNYFLADADSYGIYLARWISGYNPQVGDALVGNINEIGFKDVLYTEKDAIGRIYIENYQLTENIALEKIADKCK